jgi:hypothetical protein
MLFIIYDMRNLFYDLPDELIQIINKYKPWYWEAGGEEHIEKNKKTITRIGRSPMQPWCEFRKYFVEIYHLRLNASTLEGMGNLFTNVHFLIWDNHFLLWRPAFVKPNYLFYGRTPGYSTTCVIEYKYHEHEEWDYCENTYWRRRCQPNMPWL